MLRLRSFLLCPFFLDGFDFSIGVFFLRFWSSRKSLVIHNYRNFRTLRWRCPKVSSLLLLENHIFFFSTIHSIFYWTINNGLKVNYPFWVFLDPFKVVAFVERNDSNIKCYKLYLDTRGGRVNCTFSNFHIKELGSLIYLIQTQTTIKREIWSI